MAFVSLSCDTNTNDVISTGTNDGVGVPQCGQIQFTVLKKTTKLASITSCMCVADVINDLSSKLY